jgi:hypothetical protein
MRCGLGHRRRSRRRIMALACEVPEDSDLPLSHWSQSELAREAVRRGIVDSISHGLVGRFLKRC